MQQPKAQYITTPNDGFKTNQIVENFKNLNVIIDDLDVKVDRVIQKHQAQFLYAYRSHIKKIRFQLRELKDKSDEQEKKLTDNDRTYFLEKQITIFRQQALKLYEKLQQKQQQNQIYKAKIKDLEKTSFVEQVENKQFMKQFKMNQAKHHLLETRVAELEEQIKQKDQILIQMNHSLNEKSNQKKYYSLSAAKQSKTINYIKGAQPRLKRASKVHDSQLKQWFLECIKSIKKDVAYRKNTGYQLDLTAIGSIEEFKMVDKLRLLEKFMENEKLLTWMYEKIFPSRMNEIKDYLSHKNFKLADPKEDKNKLYDELFEKQNPSDKIEVVLPKMIDSKGKGQIRNKLSMKQGKLNLSVL